MTTKLRPAAWLPGPAGLVLLMGAASPVTADGFNICRVAAVELAVQAQAELAREIPLTLELDIESPWPRLARRPEPAAAAARERTRADAGRPDAQETDPPDAEAVLSAVDSNRE